MKKRENKSEKRNWKENERNRGTGIRRYKK